MRPDLQETAASNRKLVEQALATAKGDSMTLTQVASQAKLQVSTVKRHLDFLVSIGRVHVEPYGNVKLYALNGKGAFTDKVSLSKDHTIWVDALTNRYGDSYVRLKENRRMGDEWREMGAIIVDPDKIPELIQKLNALKDNIDRAGR